MGYNLPINGIYWDYNPLTNHLLTSWDIQVGLLWKGGSNMCFVHLHTFFSQGNPEFFKLYNLWHVHVVLNGEWGENPPTKASLKGDWGNWNCDTSFDYQVSNWNCDTLFVKNLFFSHSLIKSTLEVVRPDPSRNYRLSPNFGRRERWNGFLFQPHETRIGPLPPRKIEGKPWWKWKAEVK